MSPALAYRLFLKNGRIRILEFVSILNIGLIGNIIVSRVELYVIFEADFYDYIDWALLSQVILLAVTVIRFFDLTQKLAIFNEYADKRFSAAVKKQSITKQDFYVEEIPKYKVGDFVFGTRLEKEDFKKMALNQRLLVDLVLFIVVLAVILIISYLN